VKKSIALLAQFVLAVCLSASLADAQTPDGENKDAGKIRVLLTYGGHGFKQEPFFKMFDDMKGITYTKAALPESADMLKPGLEKKFDVIVMYDMVRGFTPEQQKALVALLNEGIGLVSLHHNIGAHRDWPEFTNIIGGKFLFKPRTIDGKEMPRSGYAHGQDMDITIAEKEHPITKGLKDFSIHDETYNKFHVTDDVKMLMTTDHPKNDPPIAWVKKYGESPVFYFMLGHDAKAWANESFPEVVERGIKWTCGKLK